MNTFLEFFLPILMMLILSGLYIFAVLDCIKKEAFWTLVILYLFPIMLVLVATPTFRHAQESLWRRALTETAQATVFYMSKYPAPSTLKEVKEGLSTTLNTFPLTGKAKDTLALEIYRDNSFSIFSKKRFFNKHKIHIWQGKDSTWFLFTPYSSYVRPLYSIGRDIESSFEEIARNVLQYGNNAKRMPRNWEEVPVSWYKNETLFNIWGGTFIYSLDTTGHTFVLSSEGFDQKHTPYTYTYTVKYLNRDSTFAEPWERYDKGLFNKIEYEIDTSGVVARIDSIFGIKPRYYSW